MCVTRDEYLPPCLQKSEDGVDALARVKGPLALAVTRQPIEVSLLLVAEMRPVLLASGAVELGARATTAVIAIIVAIAQHFVALVCTCGAQADQAYVRACMTADGMLVIDMTAALGQGTVRTSRCER